MKSKTSIFSSQLLLNHNQFFGSLGLLLIAVTSAIAQVPEMRIDTPSTALLGETFTFKLSLGNSDAALIGYDPIAELVMPTLPDIEEGMALSYPIVEASYLGNPIYVELAGFYDHESGQLLHPLTNELVTGPAGAGLYLLHYPLSSIAPNQPEAVIEVSAQVDAETPIAPHQITARGIFNFGADPTGSASAILGDVVIESVTPSLLELSKGVSYAESETATGPNFPGKWSLVGNVARGAILQDVEINDTLPDNFVVTNTAVIRPTGGELAMIEGAQGGQLTVIWAHVAGASVHASSEVLIEVEGYIAEFVADGSEVLSNVTGESVAENQFTGSYQFEREGIDPVGGFSVTDSSNRLIVNALTLALQKDARITDDQLPSGLSPEDTVEFVLDLQVSDFKTVSDVRIAEGVMTEAGLVTEADILGDALSFDATYTPSYSVSIGGEVVSGEFSASNFSVIEDPLGYDVGTSRIHFDLSAQLIEDAHFDSDGVLAGAQQLDTVSNVGTTAQIRYRASVDVDYDSPESQDASVDIEDFVFNDVDVVAYDLVDAITVGDQSNVALKMQSIRVAHTIERIVSVEGVVSENPAATPYVSPGDQVTLAIRFSIPTGDVEDLLIRDFLPYSLLSVVDVNGDGVDGDTLVFDPIRSAQPAVGQLTYGPRDEFSTHYASYGAPVFEVSAIDNSFSLNYGSFDTPSLIDQDADGVYEFELYYTVVAGVDTLPDGFKLTSLAQLTHGSTNGGVSDRRAYTGLFFSQSEPTLTKGIIACSNSEAVITPLALSQYEYAGAQGNLTGATAGDVVTFAITLSNLGSDPISVLTLKDELPSEFNADAAKIVSARRADGSAVTLLPAVDGLAASEDEAALFAGVLALDTSVAGNYLIGGSVLDGAYGAESLVLVLEAPLREDITPGTRSENLATAQVWYAAGVPAAGPYAEVSDQAQVELVSMQMEKRLVAGYAGDDASTTAIQIGDSQMDVFTIGEVVTYEITYEMPQGTAQNVILRDPLPAGLVAFAIDGVTAEVVAIDDQINSSLLTVGATDENNPHVTVESAVIEFDFGTINLAVGSHAQSQLITVRLHALVADDVLNHGGLEQLNTAELTWTGGRTQASSDFTLVRPNLVLNKTMRSASGSLVQAGTTMLVELTLSNQGDEATVSAAHDFVLEDLLQSEFFDASTIIEVDTPAGYVFELENSAEGTKVLYQGDRIDRGAVHVFRFTVQLVDDLSLLTTLENTAQVTGTSLPGISYSTIESTEVDQGVSEIRTAFPTMSKTAVGSSEAHTPDSPLQVTIGERVVYRLRVDVPEGVVPSMNVLDRVPAGMDFVGGNTDEQLSFSGQGYVIDGPMAAKMRASLLSVQDRDPTPNSSHGTDGDGLDVTFKFSSITNTPDGDDSNDYFYIDLELVVLDVPNVVGYGVSPKQLKNRARVVCAGMLSDEGWSRNVKAIAAEPQVILDKYIIETSLQGGERFTVQLTVLNEGYSAAYDVVIEDFIPGKFFKTDQILFAESNPVGWALSSDPIAFDGDADTTVRIVSDLGVAFAPGESLTFEFSIPLDDAITVASSIVNTANLVQVTSLDASLVHPEGISERDSGGATASDEIVMANADLGLSFVSTSEADTSYVDGLPALTLGERARVRVDIDLPDGTFVNPTLILELPAGLDFVGANSSEGLLYSGFGYDGFYGSLANVVSAQVLDTDPTPLESKLLDGSGIDVGFAFDTIVNLPDGDDANDDFHFYIEVVCVDESALVGYGANPSELSVGVRLLGSGEAADVVAGGVSFAVVEPALSIEKSMAPMTSANPDLVEVSIVVRNEGTSPAHDLIIEDVLSDATFALNTAEATTVPEGYSFTNNSGVLTFESDGVSIAPGASVEVMFSVEVLASAPSPIVNTARVVSSSSLNHAVEQPAGIGERQGAVVEDTAELGIPVVTLLKKVIDLDYTGEPLSAGDRIEYTLTAANIGGGVASSVQLLDSIPEHTHFVSGSMTLNGEAYTPSLPNMSIELGSLAASESQTMMFTVAVDSVLPAEAREISNTASLDFAERSLIVISDNDPTGHDPVEDDGIDSEADSGDLSSDDDPTVLPLLQAAITKRSYLAFEDLKNRGWSDWDHNDLLLDITTHTITDGAGGVKSAIVLYQIIARGAAYEAEVYLTIPYMGGGRWKTEYLETDGTLISSARGEALDTMTAEVYGSTREALVPYAEGRYEWGASRTERFDPTPVGRRSVVHLQLNNSSANPLEGFSQSPHDTWAHMVNSGEDVHRVEYELGNTQIALTGPLAGRSLPLVVEFSEGFDWPAETKSIFYSHPEYVNYIKSGGSAYLDWWRTYDEALIWVDAEGNAPGVANFSMPRFSFARAVSAMSAAMFSAEPAPWPKQLSGLVAASPVLRDLTGDGVPEILISSMDGKVTLFDGAGNVLPGWPQLVDIRPTGDISDLALRASPAVGDIDGDGALDIVVGAPSGRLYAWNLDGTRKSKFPVYLGGPIKSVCSVVDLDGDMAAEVIVHSGNSQLHVLNGNGQSLPGWPQVLGGDLDQFGSWMIGSSPTVFDMNLDGSLQIAVGSTANQIHIFNVDGSVVDGWPVTTGDWIYPTVAAVDLNGDFEPEMVAGSGDHRVYAWDAAGQLLSGFPVVLDAAVVGSVAAADLTGNGTNELVVATMAGSVYALSANGTVLDGWPKLAKAAIVASPIIIDVDGDDRLDVVAASRDNWLYVWSADGSPITSHTVQSDDWLESTPAAGDIDHDGLIELVYVAYDGTLNVVDLTSTATVDNLAWPAFRGDRSLSVDTVVTDADGDLLPDAFEIRLFGDYRITGNGDEDGDGLNNTAEWIAGSSLLDANDYFSATLNASNVNGVQQMRLTWIGRAGHSYKVYCSDRLGNADDWDLVEFDAIHYSAIDGEMSWTVEMKPGVACQFFRVVVERGNSNED